MKLRAAIVAGVVVSALSGLATGCSAPEAPADDPSWVGTVTTDGNVTTVINESGSVWGGEATLVEEASIGVETGADEYMFGEVRGVWATDDRIYVLDSQIPIVRVYDLDGQHLLDIGRRGQGPGEFYEPGGVAVTDDGKVLVVEWSMEVEVFAPDGTPQDTWNTGSGLIVLMPEMISIGDDGAVWVPGYDTENRAVGRSKLGDDNVAGPPVFPPKWDGELRCLTYMRNGRESRYCSIPFQPRPTSTLTAKGGWAVGISDRYAFDVHGPDGSVLRVERYWDPVPVTEEEAAARTEQTTELIRERADEGNWSWNGPEVPDRKPAFLRLHAERNGRIWVLREKASELSTECPDGSPECWIPAGYWLDAFGPDGRFLGAASIDHLPTGNLFVADDMLVAIVLDEAGTIMVKRYRLEPPGEEHPGEELP